MYVKAFGKVFFEAKRDSGELRSPARALILYSTTSFVLWKYLQCRLFPNLLSLLMVKIRYDVGFNCDLP